MWPHFNVCFSVGDLPKTFSQKDLEEILEPLGISAQPQIDRSITPNNFDHRTVVNIFFFVSSTILFRKAVNVSCSFKVSSFW